MGETTTMEDGWRMTDAWLWAKLTDLANEQGDELNTVWPKMMPLLITSRKDWDASMHYTNKSHWVSAIGILLLTQARGVLSHRKGQAHMAPMLTSSVPSESIIIFSSQATSKSAQRSENH